MRGLRSWVRRDLTRRGGDCTAVEDLGLRLVAADADREVGRTDAAARLLGQEALDAPVLERMERDRRHTAACHEQLPRQRQGFIDLGELIVDGDAQRLER